MISSQWSNGSSGSRTGTTEPIYPIDVRGCVNLSKNIKLRCRVNCVVIKLKQKSGQILQKNLSANILYSYIAGVFLSTRICKKIHVKIMTWISHCVIFSPFWGKIRVGSNKIIKIKLVGLENNQPSIEPANPRQNCRFCETLIHVFLNTVSQ